MKMCRLPALCVACLPLLVVGPVAAQDSGWRTIELDTVEVTCPDITVSPDGEWLIFTMLGHLFRVPAAGGVAEQLTFGPYYDKEPAFSPDGSKVAFVSDRDGSDGNVFVLDPASGRIAQVTRDVRSGWTRLTWTPNGQAIVYLRFAGIPMASDDLIPALVRRVSLAGGEPATISARARLFRAVFYLPDGRLAWTVVEGGTTLRTRVEVVRPDGTVSLLRTLRGYADRVVPSPTGGGLYGRHRRPSVSGRDEVKTLSFFPLTSGAAREIVSLSYRMYWEPQFALATDHTSLYLGERGRLWRIRLPSGTREPIPFRARVRMEIHEPALPPRWAPATPGASMQPRSVLWPRLSPDGGTLVFGAAHRLWRQPLDAGEAERLLIDDGLAGEAERLLPDDGLEWSPAFSPDGRRLAFVHRQVGQDHVKVLDVESRQTRTVASARGLSDPNWSPDGRRLVFVERGDTGRSRIVVVNVTDGDKVVLAAATRSGARPHFSADGDSVYFSSGPGDTGTVFRIPVRRRAQPQPVIQVPRGVMDGLVSPDGEWLAFQRNQEIWVAPLGTEAAEEDSLRRLSAEGGRTFALTPDGSAALYAAGARIWRHPLAGGEPEEIPHRLTLRRATPRSVLVRRVRVLDFATGGFGAATSLFLEHGSIRWIGSERDHVVPPETEIIDAGDRFAIPGLFEMHAHGSPNGLPYGPAFLAYGVTAVRNVGGYLAFERALADRGEADGSVPRYFFAGETFRGQGDRLSLDTEDEARDFARRWKHRGASLIKVYQDLPWPLQRSAAEEARRLGLPVAGHADYLERAVKSVVQGYASLEHTMPPGPYDDVLQMLARAGTRWVPTLAIRGGNNVRLHEEPERLADGKFLAFTPTWRVRQASRNSTDIRDELPAEWAQQLARIRAAHRRGVTPLLGTDICCGPSLHWELESFVEAGIPPLHVLRLATWDAAAAVGADDHLGTLEAGKLADLVLLDANPLDDIKNTQTIWRVIRGGRVLDPETLRRSAQADQN